MTEQYNKIYKLYCPIQYLYGVIMPRKGYKTITIRESLFEILSNMAEANNRTIPEMLQTIIDEREKTIEAEKHEEKIL